MKTNTENPLVKSDQLVEAAAGRIMRLMSRGDSYHLALSSTICSSHMSPEEWVRVIRRVEALRAEQPPPRNPSAGSADLRGA